MDSHSYVPKLEKSKIFKETNYITFISLVPFPSLPFFQFSLLFNYFIIDCCWFKKIKNRRVKWKVPIFFRGMMENMKFLIRKDSDSAPQ